MVLAWAAGVPMPRPRYVCSIKLLATLLAWKIACEHQQLRHIRPAQLKIKNAHAAAALPAVKVPRRALGESRFTNGN